MKTDTRTVAEIIAKLVGTKTAAEIIGSFLSASDNFDLNDEEASVAQCIFDTLVELCPNAVEVAQGVVCDVSHATMVEEMAK
jgi:hypothetical protein